MPRSPRPRPLTPAHIRRQVVLEEHDVSPDGRFAIVVRRVLGPDRFRSHLWLVPLDGPTAGQPRQLTSGAVRDTRPRIRPDSRAVAFRRLVHGTRGKHDAERQVYLLALRPDGSAGAARPRAITRGPYGVWELAWSPGWERIAFTREAGEPRFIVGPERPGREPTARRIRRLDWRYDREDHLDRFEQLFVQEARTGAAAGQLTHEDASVEDICWTPDGSALLYAADPRTDADLQPRLTVWRVALAGGPPVEVIAAGTFAKAPSPSPDGRWIAAVGVLEPNALDDHAQQLILVPADGSAPPHALAPELDRPIGCHVDTDLHGWSSPDQVAPRWLDERTLVALVSDRGRCAPWRFRVDPATGRLSEPPSRLTDADIASHSLSVAGGLVSTLATQGTRPMELLALPADVPTPTVPARLTRIGSAWMGGLAWPEMRSVLVPGPGGDIETWIASPPGAAGDSPLPTVIDIHGGPLGAWAPAPHLEVAMLTGRGYRVLLPNIRGSATYGRDWIRPQLGDWGGVDADDVLAALDHAIGLGLADRERVGLLGLSYGGFMVQWLIGVSDRFGAAVAENGVTNQVSAWANSDTGPEYSRSSLLGDVLSPEGVEKLWRQSPLRNVAAIRTPLLMLQGEDDRRCPPADNEQLFVALRTLRRTVEYVLYPEESHIFSAIGRPDRRIDRMTRMLAWFDRYLVG